MHRWCKVMRCVPFHARRAHHKAMPSSRTKCASHSACGTHRSKKIAAAESDCIFLVAGAGAQPTTSRVMGRCFETRPVKDSDFRSDTLFQKNDNKTDGEFYYLNELFYSFLSSFINSCNVLIEYVLTLYCSANFVSLSVLQKLVSVITKST